MSETRPLTVGTINGGATPILADVTSIGSAVPVRITLTSNYATLRPPGYPSRPALTGVDAADLDSPRVIASGTTLALLKPEADALVAAGAATYA